MIQSRCLHCKIPLNHFNALCSTFAKFLSVCTAGDIRGALQTLRSLLLFYPSDKDSLDNLQLYYETLGGDTESQETQPAQVQLNVHDINDHCDA